MIKLPKKAVRDLISYKKLTDLALESGRDKYSRYSARSLHDMRIFWYLMRFAENKFMMKNALKFWERNDFRVPQSVFDFIDKNYE